MCNERCLPSKCWVRKLVPGRPWSVRGRKVHPAASAGGQPPAPVGSVQWVPTFLPGPVWSSPAWPPRPCPHGPCSRPAALSVRPPVGPAVCRLSHLLWTLCHGDIVLVIPDRTQSPAHLLSFRGLSPRPLLPVCRSSLLRSVVNVTGFSSVSKDHLQRRLF